MIEITDPRIDSYLMEIAPEADEFISEMEAKAKATDFPIVDRLVGRLLYLLTRLKQPMLIVEMGSGFGYSSYWFAKALSIRGKLVLIDEEEANIPTREKYSGIRPSWTGPNQGRGCSADWQGIPGHRSAFH